MTTTRTAAWQDATRLLALLRAIHGLEDLHGEGDQGLLLTDAIAWCDALACRLLDEVPPAGKVAA